MQNDGTRNVSIPVLRDGQPHWIDCGFTLEPGKPATIIINGIEHTLSLNVPRPSLEATESKGDSKSQPQTGMGQLPLKPSDAEALKQDLSGAMQGATQQQPAAQEEALPQSSAATPAVSTDSAGRTYVTVNGVRYYQQQENQDQQHRLSASASALPGLSLVAGAQQQPAASQTSRAGAAEEKEEWDGVAFCNIL